MQPLNIQLYCMHELYTLYLLYIAMHACSICMNFALWISYLYVHAHILYITVKYMYSRACMDRYAICDWLCENLTCLYPIFGQFFEL